VGDGGQPAGVVGRVFVTVWPLDRAQLTDQPDTFERVEGTG
jgi:hypothetical protein